MKLKCYLITQLEVQDYLDKYQEKIKFIYTTNKAQGLQKIMIVIDEA